MRIKIPLPTAHRLSVYHRVVADLKEKGISVVSSEELAVKVGTKAAVIRKDLAQFGEFGVRGMGYPVPELQTGLARLLGLNRPYNLVIVGAGELGVALGGYSGYASKGVKPIAYVDVDPRKIGTQVHQIPVHLLEELPVLANKFQIDIALLCVPIEKAQEVTRMIIESKIPAILNFTPVRLAVPKNVSVQNVDVASQLDLLRMTTCRTTMACM